MVACRGRHYCSVPICSPRCCTSLPLSCDSHALTFLNLKAHWTNSAMHHINRQNMDQRHVVDQCRLRHFHIPDHLLSYRLSQPRSAIENAHSFKSRPWQRLAPPFTRSSSDWTKLLLVRYTPYGHLLYRLSRTYISLFLF